MVRWPGLLLVLVILLFFIQELLPYSPLLVLLLVGMKQPELVDVVKQFLSS